MGARMGVVLLSAVCSLSLSARKGAGADGSLGVPPGALNPGPVRIEDRFTAAAVRGAMEGAQRRLGHPRCQEVLAEFSDAAGRSLRSNLEALGESGGSYMENHLLIYDGKDQGRCRNNHVMAFTQPGSRVVMVCGRAFQSAWWGDSRLAEAILIHETLHSLGLGENPPTSGEITARVMRKCQR